MPVRTSALTQAIDGLMKGAETRLYGQLRFGKLASILLLDDRQYRDRHVCTRGGKPGSSTIDVADCPALADPERTLLGATQEAWLDRALAQSTDGWQIVGQQTLFGPRELAESGKPPVSVWNDGWDGYPAARERLLASLRKAPQRNAVLLGGDVHENWVGHVKSDYADAASASLGVEFCGTSITSRSGGGQKTAQWLARNPHFVFAEAERRGYGVCEFTPRKLSTTLRVVGDVTRRDTGIETLAQFSVAAGSARIEKV